jgi:hypothetical protein
MSNLSVAEKTQGSFKQLTLYTFVGIVNNLAGYLVYLFVTYFGAMPKIIITLLYGVDATIVYFGNRNFTLSHKGSLLGSSVSYFIAHFFGYFINFVTLIIFVNYFMYPHQWVQAVAIFVVACFLFIAFKFFVFTNLNVLNADRL